MEQEHGVGGDLVVRVVDVSSAVARSLTADLGSLPVGSRTAGRVTIRGPRSGTDGRAERPSRAELAGDAGDGLVVGQSAGGFVVADRHGWYELSGTPADLEVRPDPRLPGWALLRGVVRPAIQIAGLDSGVAVAHAAAVEIGGRGVLIAGWSESGKTETALALAESGAGFVGDKWIVVAPSPGPEHAGATHLTPFPVRVGIRDWVLPFLPRLGRALGGRKRVRLSGGHLVEGVGRRIASLTARSPATDAVLGPAGQLASLAATVRLPLDHIRRAYGQDPEGPRPPLGAVIVLTTIEADQSPGILPLDPAEAARRMARSAAYERRGYHLLGERLTGHPRAGGSGPLPVPGFGIAEHERSVLERLVAGVPVFEVRAPFPADPALAATIIRAAL